MFKALSKVSLGSEDPKSREDVVRSREELVKAFYQGFKRIHAGDEKAVTDLVNLFDEEATVEFAGAYPFSGEFRGRTALQVLFNNVARASGKPVESEGRAGEILSSTQFELGPIKVTDGKAVAEWESVVSTKDGRGFTFAGSNTFTFTADRIKSVRFTASPKAEPHKNLSLDELTVSDIGRLALAAWCVV